jgi:hypothetical protein
MVFKNAQTVCQRISNTAIRVAAIALTLTFTVVDVHAADSKTQGDGIGTPRFSTDLSVTNFSANANTIPYFRSQFTDPTNGRTYAYTMVGTNPANGDHSTTIPTVIIPFRLTFARSSDPHFHTLDGSTRVGLTVNSPVFQVSDVGAAADATASAPPALNAGRTVNEPPTSRKLRMRSTGRNGTK